jgi:hypothetical protein
MSNPIRIVWLASYPKSGSTWVRFMLLNLLLGKQATTEKLDTLIPDIHNCPGKIHFQPGFPQLVKTHYMLTEHMPLYEMTTGVIYVVRNPMDIALSAANYACLKQEVPDEPDIRNRFLSKYLSDFAANGGDPEWIEGRLGTWEQNVRSWVVDHPTLPLLMIRYEDLIADAAGQLARINHALKFGKDTGEVLDAVESSTFERMRDIEENELRHGIKGFFHRESSPASFRSGNRFMRAGRIGGGRASLTPDQHRLLVERFRPMMDRMGYEAHL